MSAITTSAVDTPARRSMERTWDDLAMVVLAAVTLLPALLGVVGGGPIEMQLVTARAPVH